MSNVLTKILGAQKEWKAMEARANALPRGHRLVYAEMKSYPRRFAAGDGMDCVAVLEDVLGLFGTSAALGKSVQDVTGRDVAAFFDERWRGTTSCFDKWRPSLNRDVTKKFTG